MMNFNKKNNQTLDNRKFMKNTHLVRKKLFVFNKFPFIIRDAKDLMLEYLSFGIHPLK